MNQISHWPGSEADPPVATDKKYSLFVRNELTLNWDDLEFLRDALTTVPQSRGTYIRYNETGVTEYLEGKQ
jgi:hypothetical protein